jgi:hypothetical protein
MKHDRTCTLAMAMQDCIISVRETQCAIEVLEAFGQSMREPAPAFFCAAI